MKTPFQKAGFKDTDVFTLKECVEHPDIQPGETFTLKEDDGSFCPYFWNHDKSDDACVWVDDIQISDAIKSVTVQHHIDLQEGYNPVTGITSERCHVKQETTADADGWIAWAGGECPVKKGTLIDFKYRDGSFVEGEEAGHQYWGDDNESDDIIAYRLHQPETKQPEAFRDCEIDTTTEQFESLAKPVWGGDGLPPVGTKCEIYNRGEWAAVEIKYVGSKFIIAELLDDGREGAYDLADSPDRFRPLRTEAERHREEAVQALSSFFGHAAGLYNLHSLYDAIASGKIPGVEVKR